MTKGTDCDSVLEGREQPPQGAESIKGVVKTAPWSSGHLCPSTWLWISSSYPVLSVPFTVTWKPAAEPVALVLVF